MIFQASSSKGLICLHEFKFLKIYHKMNLKGKKYHIGEKYIT